MANLVQTDTMICWNLQAQQVVPLCPQHPEEHLESPWALISCDDCY